MPLGSSAIRTLGRRFSARQFGSVPVLSRLVGAVRIISYVAFAAGTL
jgi:hypothetical protein